MDDPLKWLLHNNVRYVIWMPRDNDDHNRRFRPIFDQIKARYFWHHLYGDNDNFAHRVLGARRRDRVRGDDSLIGHAVRKPTSSGTGRPSGR